MSNDYIKITNDPTAQATMIILNKGQIARTVEVSPQCFVDVSEDHRILGVELLGPSTTLDAAVFPEIAIDFKASMSTFRINDTANVDNDSVAVARIPLTA